MPAKTEAVAHGVANLPLFRLQRRVVEIALGAGILEVDRRRDGVAVDGQRSDDRFDAAAGAEEVAELAFENSMMAPGPSRMTSARVSLRSASLTMTGTFSRMMRRSSEAEGVAGLVRRTGIGFG